MTTLAIAPLDFRALNQSIQPMVVAMFWGAVATAVVVPIAGAVGSVVSGKVEKKWGINPTKHKGGKPWGIIYPQHSLVHK